MPAKGERIQPVTPEEIAQYKVESIPDIVIQVVNALLTESAHQGYATIRQKDIIANLVRNGLSESQIFARGWLNFESIYEANGWEVSYDKPGFNESYDATFTFRARR